MCELPWAAPRCPTLHCRPIAAQPSLKWHSRQQLQLTWAGAVVKSGSSIGVCLRGKPADAGSSGEARAVSERAHLVSERQASRRP